MISTIYQTSTMQFHVFFCVDTFSQVVDYRLPLNSHVTTKITSMTNELFNLNAEKIDVPMILSFIRANSSYLYLYILIVMLTITFAYLITKKKNQNMALSEENQYLQLLSLYSNELVFKFDMKSRSLDFLYNDSSKIKKDRSFKNALITHLNESKADGVDILLHETDEYEYIYRVYHFRPSNSSDYIIGKLIDIRDDVKKQESLIKKARVDGITNLYNAHHTKDMIDLLIKNRPSNQKDALILIDIDDFKDINDTLGHFQGDLVLKDVAVSLKEAYNDATIIGRIGGDEFMLYIENVELDKLRNQQTKEFRNSLRNLDYPLNINSSVGICIVENRMGYEESFIKADIALYQDKKNKTLS